MYKKSLLTTALAIMLVACAQQTAQTPATVNLRILETSDLHANIMDYNYYTGNDDPTIGLARTASLIEAARQSAINAVLVDNGDLLQGSPMGDYMAHTGLQPGQVHPVYKAMNLLDYTVGNIGNHEFNYGLDFLHQSLAGARFPYINANVYCAAATCWDGIKQGQHLFTPYIIKPTPVTDTNGESHTLNIGYIGFVPPQILQWDQQNLRGKVRADSILETAKRLVPEMKAKGADIIIAIPHSGIGSTQNPGEPMAENAVYAITQVPGVNAVLFGHSHSIFPSQRYSALPNVDVNKGLMNGVPAVMPGRWGDNMGQVDFTLSLQDGKWKVLNASAKAVPIYDGIHKKPLVTAETRIHQAVAAEDTGTKAFMERPIGAASADMYSFLAQVQDDPTVQMVANAQIARVKTQLPKSLQSLPVLSASAPFKAGGRHSTTSDADQYIQVPKGVLSYKNAADLYLYPNTMVAVKVTGAELKDWLECSANQFNQIDPQSPKPQQLINDGHPTYNFDIIDGISYRIDVTQPSKFGRDCQLINPEASRIVDLSYQDAAGKRYSGDAFAHQQFIVATNNYRAFGGKFSGTGSSHVVMELPDSNREALVAYITEKSHFNSATGSYDATVDPAADYNWDFKDIKTAVPLDIRFESQNSPKADAFIRLQQHRPMTKLAVNDLGFAEYRIDLTATH
ncbi:bifunctional 2',3'-cyclic-nucleotide 2'-phosphodiesterase/3'-nucleotidase [Shewanella sp. A32]|uniref:bifunctional 2',3'-cyclic-nucleotide 2'-phosphodiesterase/3'-nucleotidase n=1 Tax=Shewanella sp. A32 TaxID=3031327 RepID=UPI0023B8FFE5|nr:bifunctional 2',3'-cyclic-nucleotide 2'-phosphodiesterase/3'-nucleotidase [Shewanella sp. A32]MDF0535382.1 bifunctional 2',3'-cyclic-nucleotide 2'-phosphodiesterase/3'-nucleotidase [Shewanella sp. A32]